MVSISAVKNIANGVSRAFGRCVSQTSLPERGASIFSGTVRNAAKTAEISTGKSSFKEVWAYTKRYFSTAKIGLKKADVQKLDSLEMPKFWQEAENILCQKIGIPQDFAPVVYSFPQLGNPRLLACFSPATYNISISEAKIANLKKPALFSALAHELQHCKQYLTILQDSKLGPQAIKHFSDGFAKFMANSAVENYRKLPMEYWEKLAKENNFEFDIVGLAKKIKQATPQELTNFVDKFKSDRYNERVKILGDFRKTVIEKMGELPEDMTFQAALYFSYLVRSVESNAKGIQYYINAVEGEAYAREIGAMYSYLFHKFI